MKKLFSLFITLIFILLCNVNVYAADTTNKKLEDTLVHYLSHSLEVQKELNVIDNKYIVPDSDLYKYDRLRSELLAKFNSGIGVKIKWYDVKIHINSIDTENDLIKVDLDNIAKFKYENTDFDSGYIENHIIYLTNGDNLLVKKDIFELDSKAKKVEEEFNSSGNTDGYKEYINNKIKYLEERQSHIDKDIEDFKQPAKVESSPQTNRSVIYNAQAAATWALNNVYAAEDYPDADCTNFVSKAVNNGGIPTDGTWYQGSNAWIRVIEFRDWLINKGYANQYSSYSYAQLGDVIQYKKASNGVWSHSVIVTGKDNWSSYPYISAHSIARYNELASNLYPNGSTFSGYRVLDVHGL